MKKKKKIICLAGLICGLIIFILEIVVFQKPDGLLGFLICLVSIYMIIGGIIGMCIMSERFKRMFLVVLECLGLWGP